VTAISDLAMIWIGLVFAAGGFSFVLFGDNYLFTFGEHCYLGGFCAFTFFTVWNSLYATAIVPISSGRWLLTISLALGALVFTRLTRFRWAARYFVCILSGIGVGLILGLATRSEIIGQLSTTLVALQGISVGKIDMLSAAILVIGIITSLFYFTYTREHTGNYGRVVRVGRLFLMASFGYILLSDNVGGFDALALFLQKDWTDLLKGLGVVRLLLNSLRLLR